MVEVLLLGPVRAVVDGRVVDIGSGRQRAILAALALSPGRVVSLDALAEVLWGEDLPSNARGNVQSHVSRLRSRLGEGAVVHEAGGYRLLVRGEDVDASRVAVMARSGRALLPGDPADAAALFARALACWRGPALGDLADLPAFAPDVARLAELRLALQDDLHEASIAAGDAEGVLPDLEAAASTQPLRERSQLLLMRALASVGRSAEALRAGDRYRKLLVEETGLDPGPALAELERTILDGEPRSPTPGKEVPTRTGPPARSLPRLGRFVGRGPELDVLRDAARRDRLVTVVGPGGVGKTRLVAELLAAGVDRRAFTVELAAVAPGEVASAVAAAMGVTGDDPEDAVAEYLSVEGALVVLDNCEHVLGAVRPLASRLLAASASVTVLATSRRRLGIHGERLVPLPPLPMAQRPDPSGSEGRWVSHPGEPPGAGPSPAAELVIDRMRLIHPSFVPDDRELADLEALCRRLDGLPLALELAASRAAVLGTGRLLEALERSVDILDGTAEGGAAHARAADRRHATLRSVIEWSLDLLEPESRRLLAALAVFEGGFDLAAAEQIASLVTRLPAAEGLASLVEASLVLFDRASPAGGPVDRYRMLETVRERAAGELAATGEGRGIAARHAELVCARATELAAAAVGPGEVRALAELDADRANVRAAQRWILANRHTPLAVQLTAALGELVLYRPDAEVVAWLRDVAGRLDAADQEGAVLCGAAARAAFLQGDLEACESLARRSIDLSGSSWPSHLALHALGVLHLYRGDHHGSVRWWSLVLDDPAASVVHRMDALGGLALARCYGGDMDAARAAADEHEALARLLGSPTHLAFDRYVLGECALAAADRPGAIELFSESARLASEVGAGFVKGVATTALVSALVRERRHDEALDRLHAVMELWLRSGTWPQLWTTMRLLAELLAEVGRDAETAVLLLDAALRDPAAPSVSGADATRLSAIRRSLEGSLGTSRVSAVRTMALALSRTQVLERAMAAARPGA